MPVNVCHHAIASKADVEVCSVALTGDDNLTLWTKTDRPLILYPPGNELVGFRDPFIIQQGGCGKPWKLILGSGIRGKGGTLLLYTSDSLQHGVSLSHPMTADIFKRHGINPK